jgi:CzcA family heavy metal efflux pump
MLSYLIRFSIRRYGIVIAMAALIAGYGLYRFSTAGLDIFPEFAPKQVIIQTEAPGLSSEQVELLVSQPLEFALGGTLGLQTIRSESIHGLSVVTVIFPEQSDIYRNRQLINERLAQAANKLPKGITPVMLPLASSSATVLTLGLNSGKTDLMHLRGLVDWHIVPRLLAVPGVADVNVFGGETRQLQIQVNPAQLQRYEITLAGLADAIGKAANIQGSGFIENENQRMTVQVTGQLNLPGQFQDIVVKYANGRPITLGEVAKIDFAPKPSISDAQILSNRGVIVMVIAQYGANTLAVSESLSAALKELAPGLRRQGIDFFPHLFRPADYIERSVHNLGTHLFMGGLFVLAVLYSFLYNARAAMISALAIPVSLLGAVIVLLALGINLNIMVLGGLAIALGEVVDDAIIDTENIFRRLRENRDLDHPLPIAEVIAEASLEVRASVVYASFIVALVFVPLLTLNGVAGRLFAPLGYSYILAILLSLLVALTLTPALCFALFQGSQRVSGDTPFIVWLKTRYARILYSINRHLSYALAASVALCICAAWAAISLDHKFLPELREGHYIVHTSSLPGTALQESIRTGSQLARQFMAVDGVESVSQWAGRAERGADTYGSHYSEFEIRLKPVSGERQEHILKQLRGILDAFPGLRFEANSFLIERIDETIAGYTSPVVVNLFGSDLSELDAEAMEISTLMKTLPGAANVQVRSPTGLPCLQVHLNHERLRFFGLNPEQVYFVLQTAYETATLGKLFQGNAWYDIALSLPPSYKSESKLLGDLPLTLPESGIIHLSQVADIEQTTCRYNILRQNFQRKQTVTAALINTDTQQFVDELRQKIATMRFAAGHYAEITGSAVEQGAAQRELYLHALLAGSGILMLVYMAIGNLRQMALTLVNLPFALVGGVAAVFISGAPLSVGSVVGFITLFGITVRNAIMLLSHCRHLTHEEGLPWNFDTLARAAGERLPSIMMTALVTGLAMSPIAFNSDNPGSEIMGPMAAIIIGGLLSSTVLNLLLLPCLLNRFGKAD